MALCASLPRAKARGAICVSVLASKLADTLSLDYQRSSHPTQYPTKFLDIAQDFHLVLRLWIATSRPKSAPQSNNHPSLSGVHCSIPCLLNQEVLQLCWRIYTYFIDFTHKTSETENKNILAHYALEVNR